MPAQYHHYRLVSLLKLITFRQWGYQQSDSTQPEYNIFITLDITSITYHTLRRGLSFSEYYRRLASREATFHARRYQWWHATPESSLSIPGILIRPPAGMVFEGNVRYTAYRFHMLTKWRQNQISGFNSHLRAKWHHFSYWRLYLKC